MAGWDWRVAGRDVAVLGWPMARLVTMQRMAKRLIDLMVCIALRLLKCIGSLDQCGVGESGGGWDDVIGIAVKTGSGGEAHGAAGEVDAEGGVGLAGNNEVEAGVGRRGVFEPAFGAGVGGSRGAQAVGGMVGVEAHVNGGRTRCGLTMQKQVTVTILNGVFRQGERRCRKVDIRCNIV